MSEYAEKLLKALMEKMLFRGPLPEEGWAIEQIDSAVNDVEQENTRLRDAQRWIPFCEQRPPDDPSRYAVHVSGDNVYWCALPPRPEV